MDTSKQKIFKGRTLEPIQSEYVGLDDIISVNGIVGWLDFIGENMIAVVDEKEILHKIATKDIRSVVKYSNLIEGNLCTVAIKELFGKTIE
jgi:hypothetical protein|nr:MAG TPA: hypothetical protein [Caudoviricetes sp.]